MGHLEEQLRLQALRLRLLLVVLLLLLHRILLHSCCLTVPGICNRRCPLLAARG